MGLNSLGVENGRFVKDSSSETTQEFRSVQIKFAREQYKDVG